MKKVQKAFYCILFIASLLLIADIRSYQESMGKTDPVKRARKNQSNVIALFYKPGCPYCQYLKPLFKQLEKQDSNNITFVMTDITTQPTYYKTRYHFTTVPTVVYYKDNEKQLSHGSDNKTVTLEKMQKHIKEIYR